VVVIAFGLAAESTALGPSVRLGVGGKLMIPPAWMLFADVFIDVPHLLHRSLWLSH